MSFGHSVGRGIGKAAAYAVEGAVRGAAGLGQFGADVVQGTSEGYTLSHAQLLVTREQKRVAYEAAKTAAKARANATLVAMAVKTELAAPVSA